VYVYLYAIDLYSSDSGKSQRRAAEETRKYFGLTTFAHTTLGRALKAFIRVINDCAKTSNNINSETPEAVEAKSSGIPTLQATEALRKKAATFLRCSLVQKKMNQVVTVFCEIGRKWFIKYQRFLL
jgi:hypothetical protein